eukprot:4869970-Amphidinium_carterae.1
MLLMYVIDFVPIANQKRVQAFVNVCWQESERAAFVKSGACTASSEHVKCKGHQLTQIPLQSKLTRRRWDRLWWHSSEAFDIVGCDLDGASSKMKAIPKVHLLERPPHGRKTTSPPSSPVLHVLYPCGAERFKRSELNLKLLRALCSDVPALPELLGR